MDFQFQLLAAKIYHSNRIRAARNSIACLFSLQVHFADDAHLVKVVEFEDDLESQEMRECYWEVFARDRARFRDRIQQAAEILNPVLDPSHRKKVFQEISLNQKPPAPRSKVPSQLS
jgi:hypothetical protein